MKRISRLILLVFFLTASLGIQPAAGQGEPRNDPRPAWLDAAEAVFLPLIASPYNGPLISGQVTDDWGNPLAGVTIQDGAGNSATTSSDGSYRLPVENAHQYSISPLKEEIGFAPTALDVGVQSSITNLDFTGMSGCADLVQNGGFETAGFWELSNAEYSTHVFNSGGRALELSGAGVSYARSAALSIPAEAENPLLRLWLFPKSVSPGSMAASLPSESDTFFGPDEDANDLQAVQVLLANGTPLETLWEANGANNQEWGLVQFNLHDYAGQTIQIGFRVQNDGSGSATSLFVDDISLTTCPTILAPEDYAQNMDAPALPEACANQLINSGFEGSGGWGIPYTPFPAGYVDRSPYPEEVYAGNRAIRTGIPVYKPSQNRYSYSDVWQTVYIPNSASSANLTLYNKMANNWMLAPEEGEAEAANLAEGVAQFAPGAVWGAEALAGDWMYILLLNPSDGTILQTLQTWTARSNNWKARIYDLSAYRGRHVRIQMGTFNDGWDGVQSMYLDDVLLTVCDGTLPPPSSPGCPTGYSERLLNNSFENNNGWYIPVTAYSAKYTSQYKNSGLRAMQTGIANQWHNRYSYSDFGQLAVVPTSPTDAFVKFNAYFRSTDPNDKQYLLVLNSWGYWIDTLVWRSGSNTGDWVEITRSLKYKPYNGWPIRLQFGTYNNGWNGATSMFVDDVVLCTK